jgi:hypothetical protein
MDGARGVRRIEKGVFAGASVWDIKKRRRVTSFGGIRACV